MVEREGKRAAFMSTQAYLASSSQSFSAALRGGGLMMVMVELAEKTNTRGKKVSPIMQLTTYTTIW